MRTSPRNKSPPLWFLRKVRKLHLVDETRLEIWFPSTDEVSVFIETAAPNAQAREIVEIGLFAAFATRQIVNLRNDQFAQLLASALAELEHPDSREDVPDQVGDTRLIPPTPGRGRKGFEATFKNRNGLPLINLKPRGFGMMARGVGFYAPTATLALLLHLLRRHSLEARFVLVETARSIGRLALLDGIGITSQAQIAGAAIQGAIEMLAEQDELGERAEDPEDDYQLLLQKQTRVLDELVEELRGDSDDQIAIPEWLAWRLCWETTLAHYGEYDGSTYEMRRTAPDDGEGPFDAHLRQLIEQHRLETVAKRLHADCFTG